MKNKFCINCGSELKDGDFFCEVCGVKCETNDCDSKSVKQSEELGTIFCEKCGNKVIATDKFCSLCGTTVKQISVQSYDDTSISDLKSEKKKSKGKVILISAVSVTLIILIVVSGFILMPKLFAKDTKVNNSVSTTMRLTTEQPTTEQPTTVQPTTQAPTTVPKENKYILPDSDKMKLSNKDIDYLSGDELELARNEIYARHGRKFDTDYIQEYFNSQSWYNGTINPKDFSEDMLSKIEKFNVQLIADYEERLNNSVRVSFGDYSIVVPDEYVYKEIGDTVTFYEKYNHEHSDTGSTGLLFSIVKTTGVDDFVSAELLGSNDEYNFYLEYPTGLGIIEDEVANQKYIDAMNMMDSVLDTFEIK